MKDEAHANTYPYPAHSIFFLLDYCTYTDFRATPQTLQEAANVHKVATAEIVDFLKALCKVCTFFSTQLHFSTNLELPLEANDTP